MASWFGRIDASLNRLLEAPTDLGKIYEGPTLFIGGEKSNYLTQAITRRCGFPEQQDCDAQKLVIGFLKQPEAFRKTVKSFLDAVFIWRSRIENSSSEELRFEISSLQIAAKAWGPADGFRVLAFHGWLDNAATFDHLAPFFRIGGWSPWTCQGMGIPLTALQEPVIILWTCF